ncbi:MAG: enoyl-CoA hydratase [Desulfobacteraceae bacterium]|nr:enoyl-CoA hydratase/isomerase family protein [Desulfobacteraceae bacterium]MBC2754473.1 enoyl-CoA hydratase [Desulfobacteraceae bacterium]
MAYDNLIYEKKDSIALVTINRPPANSWSLAAMEDLEKILDEIENDQDIRVVILTGAGEKCFSAGMDVADAAKSPELGAKGRELWRRVDRFEKPTIAAINGHALGGGLELALSCHFRIMADLPKSKIGLTELNLGIIPGWGGTQRLYRIIGKAKALDMILFSKRIDASQALEIGLVNKIATPETLMDVTFDFAKHLATRPPLAVSCVLKAISAGIYETLDQGLEMESEGSKIVASSQDAIEGFTAFFEKREPVFKGK